MGNCKHPVAVSVGVREEEHTMLLLPIAGMPQDASFIMDVLAFVIKLDNSRLAVYLIM